MKFLLNSKRNLAYLSLVIILIMFLLLHGSSHSSHSNTGNNDALILSRDDVAAVQHNAFVMRLPVSGVLYPLQQTTVIAKVSGEVTKVAVREGESVAQNQVLAQLNTADLQQSLADKTANLAAKQAIHQLSVTTAHRYQQLLAKKFVSQNDYDNVMNQQQVNLANMHQAQAAVDEAQLQLQYATIKSIIPGVISERVIDPGVNVNIGTTLFKVVNLDTLELKAIVPADEINKITAGQEAIFSVSGIPQKFNGKVVRINPSSISGTRAFYAYIDINNAGHKLLDGMFATGDIIISKHDGSLTIPYEAVHKDQKGNFVYSIADNKIAKKYVTIGLTDSANNRAEIIEGLTPNTLVVVSNIDVQDGARVTLPS